MFQQRAESEGVQPNHHNNMPNSISEDQSDQFFPGSGIELDVCYTVLGWLKRLLWKAITQLAPSSNQGGSAHQPQLSEAQLLLANELWRVLVQPNVSPGQSVQQDVNRGGGSSPTQSLGEQPNVHPGQSVPQDVNPTLPDIRPRESYHETEIDPGQSYPVTLPEGLFENSERLNHYRPLYIAAQSGDLKTARRFIDKDPSALTAKITAWTGKTVLHVAACCWQWEFILNLLERITYLESVKTRSGKTILHYVAQGGSLKTAKALVQKNSDLPQEKDEGGCLPLFHSISSGNKELVWYLSLKTTDESSSDPSFPRILRHLIISGYHDIVLYFIRRYPDLKLAPKDNHEESLLHWLATNPSGFFSGSNLGFLERWIYKFVHVDIRNYQQHLVMVNTEDIPESILEGFTTLEPRSFATQVLRWFKKLFWKTIAQLVAYVKKVRDVKLKHKCADELVNHVCTHLSNMSLQEIMHLPQNPNSILDSAIKRGIEEIVRTLLLQFPDLIDVQLMPQRPQPNILQTAIEYRQVKIVNIVKEIFPTTTKSMSSYVMESGKTTLHLAGELATQIELLSVPGAALKMQRELQWFKEVKEIEFPNLWDCTNKEGKTPEEVFSREHKELAKDGEKWMKDTAGSCMVVSALIATVLFAAAFTVPGGNTNDDKGIPIFLRTNAFTIFAIFDALGLFSSLTSLIMFLAIITARYEVKDFLKSLPNKLIIGLGSLFVSIAAMIIAFGAALTIVLNERWHWVFVPINLLASIPVVIFVMLQLPLFLQMIQSTYGASIFRPWPSRKFA